MPELDQNALCQVGIIVKDIEKSISRYTEIFQTTAPKIVITDPEEKAHTEYRGQGTPAQAKLAFFNFGSVQVELIEPGPGPSTWREFLETHGEGVHHLAFMVKGMEGTIRFLNEKGVPLVQKGDYTGGRYAYLDSMPQLGVLLELLEND